MQTTFSTLLVQLMEQMSFNTKETCDFLKHNGIDVPYSTFSSYKSFETVPSIERARSIINAFGYQISEAELKEIISYSREESRKLKESNGYVQTGIRLSAKQFGKDIDSEQLDVMLTQRASELIEKQPSLNSYVTYLIKKDLIESGYLKEE